MSRMKLIAAIAATALLGVAFGVVGGYRYAEHRMGIDVLAMLHKDARSNLERFERIKQLAETDDEARLMSYLDSIMQLESTVIKATEHSGSNPGKQ
jgi:formate dehydrogenase maturation protein FdhE